MTNNSEFVKTDFPTTEKEIDEALKDINRKDLKVDFSKEIIERLNSCIDPIVVKGPIKQRYLKLFGNVEHKKPEKHLCHSCKQGYSDLCKLDCEGQNEPIEQYDIYHNQEIAKKDAKIESYREFLEDYYTALIERDYVRRDSLPSVSDLMTLWLGTLWESEDGLMTAIHKLIHKDNK